MTRPGEKDKVRSLLSDAELPAHAIPAQFGLFSMIDRPAPRKPVVTPPPAPVGREMKRLIDWSSVPQGAEIKTPLHQWIEGQKAAERLNQRMTQSVNGLSATHHPRLGPMVALSTLILKELETHLHKLMTLNKSRRSAVVQYLEDLAGLPQRSDRGDLNKEIEEASQNLARWVEGPRSPAQNAALQSYFEEIASLILGQAVLLKAWSDRGVRGLQERDLTDLYWTLSTALKPHLPLDREGWQITRATIYSWYKPSADLQNEIWQVLQNLRITDEGPELLQHLLAPIRITASARARPRGYDASFYQSIWKRLALFGLTTAHTTARRAPSMAFTPTLRDGAMSRSSTQGMQWLGTECDTFQLLWAELHQMWWGPQAPPLWAPGSGLEAHSRDQLTLSLHSAKPSLVSRLGEMEACQFAYVLEENAVRTGSKQSESQRFKEWLEQLPYFKKLKATHTSLGELQACVALSKVRPDGLFLWAREEPLTSKAGEGVLHFLLERGRLLVEWDLSELQHQLPVAHSVFPRYVYLFVRDTDMQRRSAHRPLRVRAEGALRSYVEVQGVLEEIWGFATQQTTQPPSWSRGQLKLQKHLSPIPQKEWIDHWPDPESQTTLALMERLRDRSTQLGTVATVRATPQPVEHDFFGWNSPNGAGSQQSTASTAPTKAWKLSGAFQGLWIEAVANADGRALQIHPLPHPQERAVGQGWLILVSDPTSVAPLTQYLGSSLVRDWLDHHAERRGDRWVLSETLVRSIPLPHALVLALRSTDRPLPGEWERIAAQVAYAPQQTLVELKQLRGDGPEAQDIRAQLFVRAARALEQVALSQRKLLSLVREDGRIRWGELLQIVPRAECVSVTLHPSVRLLGTIPSQVPILRWDRVQRPQPGILFITESGFECTLTCDSRLVLEMIFDQLDTLHHPTWSELVQGLRVPRRLELAEASAHDVLRSHGELLQKLKDLSQVIQSCELV